MSLWNDTSQAKLKSSFISSQRSSSHMLKQSSILKNMRHLHGMTERFNQSNVKEHAKPSSGMLVLDAKIAVDEERLPHVQTPCKRMNVEKY